MAVWTPALDAKLTGLRLMGCAWCSTAASCGVSIREAKDRMRELIMADRPTKVNEKQMAARSTNYEHAGYRKMEADSEGSNVAPERQLACAVINAAVEDAFGEGGRNGLRRSDHLRAVDFLTSTQQEWAEAREVWCDAAGIDAEALRERARQKVIAGKLNPAPARSAVPCAFDRRWSAERKAIVQRDWPAGVSSEAIINSLHEFPGLFVGPKQLAQFAGLLGVRRPRIGRADNSMTERMAA